MRDALGLQYRSNRDLNRLIDKSLPARPKFERQSYVLGGETHDMYLRNSLDVLKELYGRPDFVRYMKFAPEKHFLRYKDAQGNNKKKQTVSEMWTGTWWWDKQVRNIGFMS